MNPLLCKQLVLKRVDKNVQLMDSIHKLNDPQSELLLLRNCSGISRIYFTVHTTALESCREAPFVFDNYLSSYMWRLVTSDGPGYGLLQHRIVTLPIRDGGLGVYTMEDTLLYCYLASCIQTQQLQITIFYHSDISGQGFNYHQAKDNYIQFCGINHSSYSIIETAPIPWVYW